MDFYIINEETVDWIFMNYFQWVCDNNYEVPSLEELEVIKKNCIKKALKRKTYGNALLLNKKTYQKADTFSDFIKAMRKNRKKSYG